jgi:general secretion pathway protein G
MNSDSTAQSGQLNEKLLKGQQGFSLIEILIALALLAMAGTFVAGKVLQSLHEGRVDSSKIQMQNLAVRLKEFRRHCFRYPTTDEGLEALVTAPSGKECKRYQPGGYIENNQVPSDPWDNQFVYESDGKTFNIKSLGGDGMEGGTDEDKDIPLFEQTAAE